MPPKPKFTKEEIVAAALDLVSEKGTERLTARELGAKMNSSSRPIFTVFNNMEEVLDKVRVAAMKRFENFSLKLQGDMPLFKRVGMQMITFSIKEPKLFQLLFMEEKGDVSTFDDMYAILGETSNKCIEYISSDYDLSENKAKILFENVWIYTFGIGVLCSTNVCRFSEDEISNMLTTEFQAMLKFLKNSEEE